MFIDSFDVWKVEDLGGVWHSMVVLIGAFQVVFYYGIGVVIGPEHLPEVLDLLPLLSSVTYLYVSSEHLGRVMLVEVELSVCVRLLAEDRGEGCSFPPLQLQV